MSQKMKPKAKPTKKKSDEPPEARLLVNQSTHYVMAGRRARVAKATRDTVSIYLRNLMRLIAETCHAETPANQPITELSVMKAIQHDGELRSFLRVLMAAPEVHTGRPLTSTVRRMQLKEREKRA